MKNKIALQLCPFSAYLEAALAERFTLVKWFTIPSSYQSQWLKDNADTVGAVVTGGHIGCSAELMTSLPNLRVIAINGVGFDKVDIPLATSRNVRVTTTPGVLTDDVADLAVGLVLSVLRKLPQAHAFTEQGRWPSGDFPLATKVSGKHFGIIGLGQIGLAVAKRLAAFGKVSYCGKTPKPCDFDYYQSPQALAKEVDVLVCCAAANTSTQGMIDKDTFAQLGKSGYFINVSRGSVVNEDDLVSALLNGDIAGAGLDVFQHEPHVPERLCSAENVVLSPHIASATQETRKAMADTVLANLDAYINDSAYPSALN